MDSTRMTDRAKEKQTRDRNRALVDGWRGIPDIDAYRKLLDQGADPSSICDSTTPLHSAVFYHQKGPDGAPNKTWEGIFELLVRSAKNPNVLLNDKTPLLSAIERDEEDAVRLLLARVDVNVDEPCCKQGWTALMTAAELSQPHNVARLLARGASVSLTDKAGRNALHWAAVGDSSKCVELLLAANADPNIRTSGRGPQTALEIARDRQPKVVALIAKLTAVTTRPRLTPTTRVLVEQTHAKRTEELAPPNPKRKRSKPTKEPEAHTEDEGGSDLLPEGYNELRQGKDGWSAYMVVKGQVRCFGCFVHQENAQRALDWAISDYFPGPSAPHIVERPHMPDRRTLAH